VRIPSLAFARPANNSIHRRRAINVDGAANLRCAASGAVASSAAGPVTRRRRKRSVIHWTRSSVMRWDLGRSAYRTLSSQSTPRRLSAPPRVPRSRTAEHETSELRGPGWRGGRWRALQSPRHQQRTLQLREPQRRARPRPPRPQPVHLASRDLLLQARWQCWRRRAHFVFRQDRRLGHSLRDRLACCKYTPCQNELAGDRHRTPLETRSRRTTRFTGAARSIHEESDSHRCAASGAIASSARRWMPVLKFRLTWSAQSSKSPSFA
jgi:hypothetical protein